MKNKDSEGGIKLLMIIPRLRNGGSERVFSYVANRINHDQFITTVVVLDAAEIDYNIDLQQVAFIDLKKKKVRNAIYSIIKTIRNQKPDIVMSTLTHLNIIISLIIPFLGKNTRFVCRESTILSENNKEQSSSRLFNFFVRNFYKRFDKIICQSKDIQQDFVENYDLPEVKLKLINNPIGFDKPTLKVETASSKKLRLITVGRVEKVKGYERIIASLSLLKLDFRYSIVGDGTLLPTIRDLVKYYKLEDKVLFEGHVKDALHLYEKADIYLHGSYFEGFPNTLLEACAFGIPIVTFDTPGGINEIIKDGFNGILVKNNDKKAFATAIEKASHTAFDKVSIQHDIFNRFGHSKIIKEYEALFRSIV